MSDCIKKTSKSILSPGLVTEASVESYVPDFSKLKVLIVDDEPMLRSVIQDFLLMLGFENQRVAGDGIEALDVMRSESIDCMLSDIRMPKMELEELLGVIKQEFPRMIVLATSGFSDLESAHNIFVKGAHDFIGKPLNLDALEWALQWVVERQRILQTAERLFGKSALPVPAEEAGARLGVVRQCLATGAHHFQTKMRHSIRMADLIGRLQTSLVSSEGSDLYLAALLHELGTGYQIHSLCHKPRVLDDDERRLVQEHARISGRLISWALGRNEFQPMIGRHLTWQATLDQPESQASPQDRISVWLGLINTLDGYLHDRPDRPGVSTRQLFDILTRKYKDMGWTPPGCLLDQWNVVETFYAECDR